MGRSKKITQKKQENKEVQVQIVDVIPEESHTENDSKANTTKLNESVPEESAELKNKRKISSSMIKNIVIGLLLVTLFAVLIVLAISKNPLDKVVDEFTKNNPDSSITIQKITSENSKDVKAQIINVCPGFSLDEFYIAQIVNFQAKKDIVYVINPLTGAIECKIDNAAAVQAQSGLTSNLLATVNGENIYADDVLALYNSVPENIRTNQTLQQVFDQLINNKLLLQDAARKGLSVSEAEVDAAVSTFLRSNSLDMEGLERLIKQSNSTIEKFRNGIKDSLLLQKIAVELTKNTPNATEEEASDYYIRNKENITTIPASVTRQLTIYANNTNSDAKLQYVKTLGEQINTTNFCEIVAQYSEDVSTKDNCGTYNTRAGDLLPEYEQAVFESKPGDRKIIGSRIGYHIIEIVSITPSKQLTYDEARQEIVNYLSISKKQKVLADYLATLKESADIKNYAAQNANQAN